MVHPHGQPREIAFLFFSIKYWTSACKSINAEWFLLIRFLDLVRDIRILTGLDGFVHYLMSVYDTQRRTNPHVNYRDLVSWVARNQELDLRNYVLKKFLISFAIYFDEDNIVKLGIDHDG